MAQLITVSLDLPQDMLLTLGRAARAAGCGSAEFLRMALTTALASPDGAGHRIRMATVLATSWLDLQQRLRKTGFVLRLAEDTDQLWLCNWPENRRQIKAHELGIDLGDLCLRFQANFPGRGLPKITVTAPHRHLTNKAA